MVAGQHVPDRGRELAGKIDLRDLGAAQAAVAALESLVALSQEFVRDGVLRCLDQPPAQVSRRALGDQSAEVDVAGLADPGAEAGIPTNLTYLCRSRRRADLFPTTTSARRGPPAFIAIPTHEQRQPTRWCSQREGLPQSEPVVAAFRCQARPSVRDSAAETVLLTALRPGCPSLMAHRRVITPRAIRTTPTAAEPITAAGRPRRAIVPLNRVTASRVRSGANR